MSRSSVETALLLAPWCSVAGKVLLEFKEKPTATETPEGKAGFDLTMS